MKLELKNVGIISDAKISIDGMTVIAGKNSTGKSTFLKALYCIVDSSAGMSEKVHNDFSLNILNIMYLLHDGPVEDLIEKHKILDTLDSKGTNIEEIKNILDKIQEPENREKIPSRILDKVELMYRYLDDPRNLEVFYSQFVRDNIYGMFKNQFRNIQRSDVAEAILYDDKTICKIIVDEDDSCKIEGDTPNMFSDVVYIDTPYIMDSLNPYLRRGDHRASLSKKLSEMKKDGDVFDRLVTKDKKDRLNRIIQSIIDGTFKTSRSGLTYHSKSIQNLNVTNLATGMKTFSIIKILLDNGYIDKDSLILIDEPEIHLHPEWQLILAELLVLISKDLGTKIVLTTHSPHFLLSIEAYSMKHDLDVDYYNIEKGNSNDVKVKRVNDCLEDIYRSMADAYSTIDEVYENEKYRRVEN